MVFLLSLYLELSIAIILWLLVAFLLGMLFSYLLGAKTRDRVAILEKDLSAMTAKANGLEADLSTAKYEKDKIAEELAKEKSNSADLYFKLKACEEKLPDEDAAEQPEMVKAAPLGFATVKVDDPKLEDLKIVEGIGPKLEEYLKSEGIANLAVMAQSNPDDIKSVLDKEGERFRLADPTTWPKQAQMAVDGHWDRLKEYQDFLQGGKE